MRSIDLSSKSALIFGVANQRSLAWAIAEALGDAGCRMAFTYQGERLQKNVTKLTEKYSNAPVIACDVTSDEQIEGVFGRVRREFGNLDILIHSIAFAPREELEGAFYETSIEGWRTALEISAYSMINLTKHALPLMENHGGSIVALEMARQLGQKNQRVLPLILFDPPKNPRIWNFVPRNLLKIYWRFILRMPYRRIFE